MGEEQRSACFGDQMKCCWICWKYHTSVINTDGYIGLMDFFGGPFITSSWKAGILMAGSSAVH